MFARISKSIQIGSIALRQHPRSAVVSQIKRFSDKSNETTTTEQSDQQVETSDKLGTFAKAFQEIQDIAEKPDQTPVENLPFKKLLRQSHLIDVSVLFPDHFEMVI